MNILFIAFFEISHTLDHYKLELLSCDTTSVHIKNLKIVTFFYLQYFESWSKWYLFHIWCSGKSLCSNRSIVWQWYQIPWDGLFQSWSTFTIWSEKRVTMQVSTNWSGWVQEAFLQMLSNRTLKYLQA